MDLRKIGLGVLSMALGVAGLVVKQAMAVSLINSSNWASIQSQVEKPLGGPVGLFFLFTWIIGIWLVVSGFRSKAAKQI
jgi:hypothetical protein